MADMIETFDDQPHKRFLRIGYVAIGLLFVAFIAWSIAPLQGAVVATGTGRRGATETVRRAARRGDRSGPAAFTAHRPKRRSNRRFKRPNYGQKNTS